MMLKVSIPASQGNRALKDGSLTSIMQKALAELKPEAAYFGLHEGNRTAFLFADVKDVSMLPSICEPFFLGFDAAIDMTPVMNADELRAGLQLLQKP
ncbi:hypothetical protein [Mesorhizobium sp. ANAO-SY3R2]|uniref:hypothetical protein n=1 Tax=Mesorhizobium sp. ANAO-SY3R2 TaxID=3166644 RepID=UPI00366E2145